jgi:hypothetical protein
MVLSHSFEKAERLDLTGHQEVNEFYRSNGYRSVRSPTDILWVLWDNDEFVGDLILSPQRFRPFGDMIHLRSLVVVTVSWSRGTSVDMLDNNTTTSTTYNNHMSLPVLSPKYSLS